MSDQDNERENAEKEGNLDNLSDSEKKETKEILDDIQKEEGSDKDKESGEDKSDEEKDKSKDEDKDKDKDKSKDEDKSEDKDKDKSDDKEDKSKDNKEEDKSKDKEPPRSKTKLIPEWVHQRSIDEKEKIINDQKIEIENLSKDKGQEDKKPTEDQKADLEKEVAQVAKEHNLDEKLVKSLVDLGMKFGGKLPKEVTEKLASVDKLNEDAEVKAETAAFNESFDKYVLPEIKKEYGDNVSQDTISAVKEKMKEHAYSDEYKQTPYSVIYKGVDDFRSFKRPSGSAEEGRGGFESKGGDGEKDLDFSNVTDEDIDKMDGPTFDKYSEYKAKQEGGVNAPKSSS